MAADMTAKYSPPSINELLSSCLHTYLKMKLQVMNILEWELELSLNKQTLL